MKNNGSYCKKFSFFVFANVRNLFILRMCVSFLIDIVDYHCSYVYLKEFHN